MPSRREQAIPCLTRSVVWRQYISRVSFKVSTGRTLLRAYVRSGRL
jgi:hypothetical protein